MPYKDPERKREYDRNRTDTERWAIYDAAHRGERAAKQRAYHKANLDKIRAKSAVYYALQTGKLNRSQCECGSSDVEAHHDDYSKPLEVRWLCRSCHQRLHAALKRDKSHTPAE